MSLVRPEARAAMWRWREVLAGAGVLAVGLWWALGTAGLLPWLGGALALAGGALIAAGIQRARFRGTGGGPGVVLVDEGRITYLGPFTGGTVALADLTALRLDPAARPPHWLLDQPGQPALAVPLAAEGADALFDAFATLPGIRTERMLAEMRRGGDHPVVIWQAPTARLH
jgi:hypothetical protein